MNQDVTRRIEIVGRAPHIRCVSAEERGGAFLAVIEANLKQPEAYRGQVLDHLVSEAFARLSRPIGPNSPGMFASLLSDRIKADANRWRSVGAVFYAGVVVAEGLAYVCTAGDIRVHVIADGSVVHVTRDHNAVSDDDEGIYSKAERGVASDPAFLVHVPTRAIPTGENKPVECQQWSLGPTTAVMLCSSRVHQYRSPNLYVSLLDRTAPIPDLGIAAFIRPAQASV